LKIKLTGRHVDTIEAMEAQSQMMMMNTLTEHDFQDAFKNGGIMGKGNTSGVMVVSRPNLSF
jgi:hypothetical protein